MMIVFNSIEVREILSHNKGTVGASGDLAPLAHIALGLLGIGDMYSDQVGIKVSLHCSKLS